MYVYADKAVVIRIIVELYYRIIMNVCVTLNDLCIISTIYRYIFVL